MRRAERSDFQIYSDVRSVLARNWIDLQAIRFGSFRGTVRLLGEISGLGGSSKIDSTKLESIESGIKRIRGVHRVYFDLKNWRRTSEGAWVPIKRRSREPRPEEPPAQPGPEADRAAGEPGSEPRSGLAAAP